jgi:hypothetical protein
MVSAAADRAELELKTLKTELELKTLKILRGYDMVEALRLSVGFHEFTAGPTPGLSYLSYTTEILQLLGGQALQIQELSEQLCEVRKSAREARAGREEKTAPEGAE